LGVVPIHHDIHDDIDIHADIHDAFDLADRVRVMHHGRLVATHATREVPQLDPLGATDLGRDGKGAPTTA
jgi:ABC-type proline/glycine betaine transport system ATPase subunit